MVTIDLLNALAWQRCWDRSCVQQLRRGYRKARHFVGAVPAELLPTAGELERFGVSGVGAEP